MKKIISIEKVSNGFIVTNGNLKRVYDSSPLEFELDQIHQMLYNSKDGDSHTIVIEVDPPVFTSQDSDSHTIGIEVDPPVSTSQDSDSHTIGIEVDPPVSTSQDNDSIELCGLLWDKDNLSVGGTEKDGNHYFTWTEAMEAAEKQGKRLPTVDEWKALCDLGSTWDEELRGRWFGGNHYTDHKGSIFLPDSGHYNDGDVLMVRCGLYWSSSSNIGVCLKSHGAYVGHYCVDTSIPVRCVRDIAK